MQIQLGCKYKKKGNVPVLGQQAGAKVQAQWGSRAARARSRSMDTPPADARTPHAPESVFKNEYGLKNSFDDQLDHTTIYAYERTHTRMSKWPKHTAIWCSRMHTYTYACEPMSKSMRRYYNYTNTRTHKPMHKHTHACMRSCTHAHISKSVLFFSPLSCSFLPARPARRCDESAETDAPASASCLAAFLNLSSTCTNT